MGAEQGYVYIILGGERYDASLRMIRDSYYLRAGVVAFFLAIAATLIVGLLLFFLLTRRLKSLSDAVRAFEKGDLARRVTVQGTDELGALGRSFNEMASTIEADVEKIRLAERMRRDLIGNISHDLRSPLASIQGYLETMVLKDSQLTPEERNTFLKVSLRNTANLQRLVEELFELAKLDARQVQLRPEPLQIAELAQDVALKLAPEAQGVGVSLTVEPGGDLPLVTGDVGMIERVLTNLIENALRFTPSGGAVRAILDGQPGAVRVTVADTGTGILRRTCRTSSSASTARTRAGTAPPVARGWALPLPARSWSCTAARWRWTAGPGEGARFSFILPAHAAGAAGAARARDPNMRFP